MPDEVMDAHMLAVLGIPLAASSVELDRVPALLVYQRLIILTGQQDAQEWAEVKAKEAANRAK